MVWDHLRQVWFDCSENAIWPWRDPNARSEHAVYFVVCCRQHFCKCELLNWAIRHKQKQSRELQCGRNAMCTGYLDRENICCMWHTKWFKITIYIVVMPYLTCSSDLFVTSVSTRQRFVYLFSCTHPLDKVLFGLYNMCMLELFIKYQLISD